MLKRIPLRRYKIIHHNNHASQFSRIKTPLKGIDFFSIIPHESNKESKDSFQKLFRKEIPGLKRRIMTGIIGDNFFDTVYELRA